MCRIRWTLPEPDGAEEAQKLTQQLLDQGEPHAHNFNARNIDACASLSSLLSAQSCAFLAEHHVPYMMHVHISFVRHDVTVYVFLDC